MKSVQLHEKEHRAWLEKHTGSRQGEAKRRLTQGHGYAEKLFAVKVWFPAVGHFEYLHPEYEVHDFDDQRRFPDFAYIRPPYRIGIEIDGFGPHARDVNRRIFADGLMRHNRLTLDDWIVFRFAVDDVEQHPRRCQQNDHAHSWQMVQLGAAAVAAYTDRDRIAPASYSTGRSGEGEGGGGEDGAVD